MDISLLTVARCLFISAPVLFTYLTFIGYDYKERKDVIIINYYYIETDILYSNIICMDLLEKVILTKCGSFKEPLWENGCLYIENAMKIVIDLIIKYLKSTGFYFHIKDVKEQRILDEINNLLQSNILLGISFQKKDGNLPLFCEMVAKVIYKMYFFNDNKKKIFDNRAAFTKILYLKTLNKRTRKNRSGLGSFFTKETNLEICFTCFRTFSISKDKNNKIIKLSKKQSKDTFHYIDCAHLLFEFIFRNDFSRNLKNPCKNFEKFKDFLISEIGSRYNIKNIIYTFQKQNLLDLYSQTINCRTTSEYAMYQKIVKTYDFSIYDSLIKNKMHLLPDNFMFKSALFKKITWKMDEDPDNENILDIVTAFSRIDKVKYESMKWLYLSDMQIYRIVKLTHNINKLEPEVEKTPLEIVKKTIGDVINVNNPVIYIYRISMF